MRYGDQRVLALLAVLVMFRLLPRGFMHRDVRPQVSALLGKELTPGQMSYDLRRLRLHGLIERVPKTHRYHVTDLGFRSALFITRSYNRLLRPGLSVITPTQPPAPVPLRRAFERVDTVIQQAWDNQQIAA